VRGLGSFIFVVLFFCGIGVLAYWNRYIPDAEQAEFDRKFDREAIFVKTCGSDPGAAAGPILKVYRFEDKLWFRDRNRWRVVDAKPENVCDVLDVEKGHEPKP